MGRRGPKSTPTDILAARGSWRADHRTAEPIPPEGAIDPPCELDPAAREIWDQVVPVLAKMEVVTTADVWQLERYVRTFVRWRLAALKLEQEGETFVIYEPDSEFDPAQTTKIEEIGLAEKIVKQLAAFNCRLAADLERAIADELLTQIKGIGQKTAAQIVERFTAWREANPISQRIKYEQQRPEVAIVNNLAKELRAIEDRFGLSPSARVGLQISEESLHKMTVDRAKQKINDLIKGKPSSN